MAQQRRKFLDEPYLYSTAGATTPVVQTHVQRKKYKDFIVPNVGPSRSYNFWGEDFYLGRVNHLGNACVVSEGSLKPLDHAEAEEPLFAVNFVADAWRDFVDEVKRLVDAGQLHPTGPYSEIKAKKAFVSAPSAYHDYMIETVYPLFVDSYLRVLPELEKQILNLHTYLGVFTEYVQLFIKNTGGMTLSSFVESGLCSPLNSGLVISTSEDDHNADFKKTSEYFLDANFEVVQAIATQYGFGIDQNAPWRFVADLSSPAMKEYMVGVEFEDVPLLLNGEDSCGDPLLTDFPIEDQYGYSSIPGYEDVVRHAPGYASYRELQNANELKDIAKAVFSSAYRECWRVDMDFLKVYIIGFYNALARSKSFVEVPVEIELDACFVSRSILVTRNTINPDFFSQNGNYGDKWNLKTYYLLRRLEKNRDHSLALVRANLKELINIYNFAAGSTDAKYILALKHLQENVIGQTTTASLTIDKIGDIKNR